MAALSTWCGTVNACMLLLCGGVLLLTWTDLAGFPMKHDNTGRALKCLFLERVSGRNQCPLICKFCKEADPHPSLLSTHFGSADPSRSFLPWHQSPGQQVSVASEGAGETLRHLQGLCTSHRLLQWGSTAVVASLPSPQPKFWTPKICRQWGWIPSSLSLGTLPSSQSPCTQDFYFPVFIKKAGRESKCNSNYFIDCDFVQKCGNIFK